MSRTHSVLTHFFKTSHNMKREARDFSALNRPKSTAGGRESGKNVVHPVLVFIQIRDILSRKAKHYDFNILF